MQNHKKQEKLLKKQTEQAQLEHVAESPAMEHSPSSVKESSRPSPPSSVASGNTRSSPYVLGGGLCNSACGYDLQVRTGLVM